MPKDAPRRSKRFRRQPQEPDTIMSSSSSLGTTKTKKPPTKALKKSAKSSNNGTATKKKPPTTVSSQKIVKLEADATSRKRPTADECWYATASLSKLHPDVVDRNNIRRKAMLQACGGGRDSITDSVVSTMLSQNTTDANSKAAFSNLKKEFPNWESLVEMEDLPRIESAIKVAGLAKTRAERMYNILLTVKKERGEASLDYIRDFSNEQIKQELSRFKGLGPKTISCVLLFALGRDEFPVDTHVLRITQKMGWVSSSGTSREQAYEYLNGVIPADLKMDLHCLLVQHGKVCHRCAANGRPQFPPKDGSKLDCPLVMISSWGGILPLQNLKSLAALRKMEADVVQWPPLQKIKTECVPDEVKSKLV